MSDAKKNRSAFSDAAKDGALATAQSLVAGAGITASVATGAVGATARVGLNLFGIAIQRQSERKFKQLMTDLAGELRTENVAETEAHLLKMIDIPGESHARSALLAAARAIFDDIDEAAIPYLARVVAPSLSTGTFERRDRRMLSMLSEVDHDSLLAIQILLELCAKHTTEQSDVSLKLFPSTSKPPCPVPDDCKSDWRLLIGAKEAPIERFAFVCPSDPIRNGLGLLIRHGFAVEGGPIWGGKAFIVNSRELIEYLRPRLKVADIPLA